MRKRRCPTSFKAYCGLYLMGDCLFPHRFCSFLNIRRVISLTDAERMQLWIDDVWHDHGLDYVFGDVRYADIG